MKALYSGRRTLHVVRRAAWFSVVALFLGAPAYALAPVEEAKTKSGLTTWIIEDHSLGLVTIRATFLGAGTASDPRGKEGLARLAASLLDEGAGEMNALAFARYRDDRAIRWNSAVDEDTLSVTIETPSGHLPDAMRLLGLALSAPRFDAEAVARMRAQSLSALAQGVADPGIIADDAWRKAVFGAHPYGRPQLGTKQGIRAVARADLRRYAARHLARDRLLLVAVGDVTKENFAALMEAHLEVLPETCRCTGLSAAAPSQKEAVKPIARDLPQTVIRFGGPGLLRTDKDYLAAYVLNHIVGGQGLSSRLTEEIREKRGLAYYAYSSLDPLLHAGVISGGFATRAGEAAPALTVLRQTLETVSAKGVTPNELVESKQYLTGSFPLMLDSNGKLANYLTVMQMYGLGKDYLEKRNRMIEAVTLEDANLLAKILYDPKRLTIVTVGALPEKKAAP